MLVENPGPLARLSEIVGLSCVSEVSSNLRHSLNMPQHHFRRAKTWRDFDLNLASFLNESVVEVGSLLHTSNNTPPEGGDRRNDSVDVLSRRVLAVRSDEQMPLSILLELLVPNVRPGEVHELVSSAMSGHLGNPGESVSICHRIDHPKNVLHSILIEHFNDSSIQEVVESPCESVVRLEHPVHLSMERRHNWNDRGDCSYFDAGCATHSTNEPRSPASFGATSHNKSLLE